MSYAHLFWNNSDIKFTKSNKNEKNLILEKEIERKLDLNDIIKENDIYETYPKNKNNHQKQLNLSNFRESIEVNLEKKYNNRDIIEKRLNNREKLKNGWFNPFLPSNSYIQDLNIENNYLRPKNVYDENIKFDKKKSLSKIII